MYIQLRAKKHTMDKCGLSWLAIQAKALTIAKKLNIDVEKFQALPGWISKFMKRKNLVGIKLHGEAGDMEPAGHSDTAGHGKAERPSGGPVAY